MKLLGLIGYPLSHSWSQDYFRTKFRNEKIDDHDYIPFPLKDISEITALIRSHSQLSGLNVTIPYKEKIIPFLDGYDAIVKETGAANTLKINRSSTEITITGYNTDVKGFMMMAEQWKDIPVSCALVLGTGGASRAVQYVLKKMKTDVILASREGKGASVLGYRDLNEAVISACQLIVNATPLGMFPDEDVCPEIPYDSVTANHIIADLIYNPAESLFLKKCRQKGARTYNGLTMLHAQAEESWRIWNNP